MLQEPAFPGLYHILCTQVLLRTDKEGNTPFHLTAASADSDILQNFIDYYQQETGLLEDDVMNESTQDMHDSDTEVLTLEELCILQNKAGETPVHLAAMAGNTV